MQIWLSANQTKSTADITSGEEIDLKESAGEDYGINTSVLLLQKTIWILPPGFD